MNTDLLTVLAIIEVADEAVLTDVLPDRWVGDERIQVENGRYSLDRATAENLRRQLKEQNPGRYRQLHEQLFDLLAGQIAAGHHAHEFAWTAIFERLANLYFAGDTPALLDIVGKAADLPLHIDNARQMRAYFQGVAAFRQDQYVQATQIFEHLLAQNSLPRRLKARTLNSCAVINRVTGHIEAAMAGYRASLSLWEELGDAHYQGIVHLNLGIMAYGLRRYAEADDHLRRAEQLFLVAGSTDWVSKVQNELGLVQRDLGRWDAALAYFDAYVSQRRQAGAGEDVGLGEANRGEVLLFKGDLPAAKQALHTALDLVVSRIYRPDHLLYLGLAYQAEGDLAAAEAYYRKSLALAQEIDRREILPHIFYHLANVLNRRGLAEAALENYVLAAEVIEASSSLLRDESLKISLLGRWQQIYEALVLHCLELGYLAGAFTWAEKARARAFADALGHDEGSRPVAGSREIQAKLPPDTALLCYFTTGVLEQDAPLLQAIAKDNPLRDHILVPARTLCFTLTSDRLTVRDCGLDSNLLTTHSPRGFQATRYLIPAVRQRLGHLLFSEEDLSHSRMTIIPHGPLHRVPFTALFPVEKRPIITFAISGSIYAQPGETDKTPREGCLAVGYNSEVSSGRFLRFTETEVRQVAHIMGGTSWMSRATRKEQLRNGAAGCRWLHIACHGWFDDAQPLDSYLEVAPGERIKAQEVLTWQLTAELVTLSACETGVSRILRGDEPMGLIRAFLAAGAQNVLVSQWPVDDLATLLLMVRFYQLIREDEKPVLSVALYQAQDWLQHCTGEDVLVILNGMGLQIPSDLLDLPVSAFPFADPVYWAAFILVGHTD